MGAEFLENKALLTFCYKICLRTLMKNVCRTLDSAAVSSPAVAFSGFLDTFLYTKNRYRSTFLFFSL